jgi:hypothetical protein
MANEPLASRGDKPEARELTGWDLLTAFCLGWSLALSIMGTLGYFS